MLRLLDEPIAAALALFGDSPDVLKPAKSGVPRAVAVFNLGGGSCDACFMVRHVASICINAQTADAMLTCHALPPWQEIGEGVFEVRAQVGMLANIYVLQG